MRVFARSFWHGGRLAGLNNLCLREDLGTTFTPEQDAKQSILVSYTCNYYIYRPSRELDTMLGDDDGAVQVANFVSSERHGQERRRRWIAEFENERGLRYTGSTVMAVPITVKHRLVKRRSAIEIMRFEPRP